MFILTDLYHALCCFSACEDNSSMHLPRGEVARSRILSSLADTYGDYSMSIKSSFQETSVHKLRPVDGHTHAQSAIRRTEASNLIQDVALRSGLVPVMVQGSAADVRHGKQVVRSHYWAKDLQVAAVNAERHHGQLPVFIDVDYYIDIETYLAAFPQPVMLYTFQPSRVSRDNGEYKYTFNEKNEVIYDVAGGGHYVHKVWNWTGDSVICSTRKFGIRTGCVIYNIERKRIDDDHQVILLTPLAHHHWWSAWWARWRLSGNLLKRLKVSNGKYLELMENGAQDMILHVGLISSYLCASLPLSVYDAIRCAAYCSAKSKPGITLGTIKSKIEHAMIIRKGKEYVESERYNMHQGAEVIQYLIQSGLMHGVKPTQAVSTVSDHVRSYQWANKVCDIDHEIKPSMVSFMKPIVDGAFVPEDCRNNDERMIDKRVKEVLSNAEMNPYIRERMMEFINHMKRFGAERLMPVPISEVYERQTRRSQINILNRADHEEPTDKVKSFMKREAYTRVNDPRNISTIDGQRKRDYSCFMYAFADAIKHFHWYAFGRTPKQIAERVAFVCEKAKYHIDNMDFARMDGRVSKVARELERMTMFNCFGVEYHAEIDKLMRSQTSLKARTKHGYCYHTGDSRLSGSPETSVFNTELTAFINYYTLRSMKDEFGQYLTPEVAWDSLGIYGGDDGLTADLHRATACRRAKETGQVLTCDRVKRGDLGVSFLSRLYGPLVWYGDADSCVDLRRCLAKFHVTTILPANVTKEQKLFDKAFALGLTDPNTPIVGKLAFTVWKLFDGYTFHNSTNIWNVELDSKNQYPNTDTDGWMSAIVERDLPEFNLAAFENWISTATVETIFEAPEFMPPVATNPQPGVVKVDDDITITTTSSSSVKEEPPQRQAKRRPPRRKTPKIQRRSRGQGRVIRP